MSYFGNHNQLSNHGGSSHNNQSQAQNNQNQQPGRRQANYTQRPFSDLIEEDKRSFVRRRFLATLLGGYRIVYNEADDESTISFLMHLLQLLIYLIMPAIVVIVTLVLKDDRNAAVIIGGVVPFALNLILQTSSYLVQRGINKESLAKVQKDLSERSWRDALLFLVPARSSIFELIICVLATGLYGVIMTYFIHEDTLMKHIKNYSDNKDCYYIITVVTIFLSSYSLFSAPIPESTPYLTNDRFSIFSHHYQRVTYSIIISGSVFIASTAASDMTYIDNLFGYFEVAYWANLGALILQMLGLLGNPIVTLMWLFEQVDFHILGSSTRTSDIRIVLSLTTNVLFLVGMYILSIYESYKKVIIMGVILAFFSSHNIWLNLGIKEPFKVVNEKFIQQQDYMNVVFSQMKTGKDCNVAVFTMKNRMNQGVKLMMQISLKSIIPYAGVIILNCIVMTDAVKFDDTDQLKSTIIALFAVAFALAFVNFILSSLFRNAIFRLIPCFALTKDLSLITQLIKVMIIFCLTFAYSCLSLFEIATLDNTIDIVFVYRAFNRLFHSPYAASLETLGLLIYLVTKSEGYTDRPFMTLFLISLCLHRLMIFGNKCLYVLISIITAIKNKKQRFKMQLLCFILQFTILSPIFLIAIIYSTVLNTATIPFLGFAYFVGGYPKPQRGWSEITPVSANPNDQRSDSHLYQAMQVQLKAQIQKMFNYDPFLFRVGSYYLIKNEKMIALIQILERGNNYLVYTFKGTELQETTVCHAEENDYINQISEKIFKDKKMGCNIPFSLSPVKQISFGIYDDQKVSLSGIISSPDFAKLVKEVFMRTLILKFKDLIKSNINVKFFKILKGEPSQRELEYIKQFYDPNLIDYFAIDTKNFNLSHESIPKMFTEVSVNQSMKPLRTDMTMMKSNPSPNSTQQPKSSFLEMIEQKNNNQTSNNPYSKQPSQGIVNQPIQNGAVRGIGQINPPAANGGLQSVNNSKIEEAKAFEDEMDGLLSPDKLKKRNVLPPIADSKSKDSNLNDLDDLDDFLGNIGKKEPAKKFVNNNTLNDPWQNAHSNKHSQPTRDEDEPWIAQTKNTNSVTTLGKNQSQQSQAQSNHYEKKVSMGQSNQDSDFEKLIFQSFLLCFKEQHASFPQTLLELFKGDFKRDMENGEFISSRDQSILHMKYAILQSVRLAFHYSLESFVMGELSLPSNEELEKEIRQYDQEWFFAGEEFLWNAAIEKNFPNLERIIEKKGQYFAHRLKYGLVEETKFNLFEFRSEVIRGIWGNINMELLYYTNANDERFSIQAEKDILRNLLVQLAEIPLGYPVYSSGAQIIYY